MMKKVLTLAAVALFMLCASCSKERQCKCVTTDVPDDGVLKILVVDHQMKCDNITEMGFEQKIVDDNGQTLQRIDMHTVSCRDWDEK